MTDWTYDAAKRLRDTRLRIARVMWARRAAVIAEQLRVQRQTFA